MGGNISKKDVNIFKKNVVDAGVKILNSTVNYTTNEALGQSVQKITFEGVSVDCPVIEITQDMKIENRVYNEIDDVQESKIANDIKVQMNDILKDTLEMSQSGISLAQINKSENNKKIITDTFTDLSTEISKETKNVFNSKVRAIAEQDLAFVDSVFTCDPAQPGAGFYIRQSVGLFNVMNNVMKSKKIDDIINNALVTHDVTSESTETFTIAGFDPTAFIGLLLTAGFLLVIGLPLFIMLMRYAMKGSKKEAPPTAFGRRRRR